MQKDLNKNLGLEFLINFFDLNTNNYKLKTKN